MMVNSGDASGVIYLLVTFTAGAAEPHFGRARICHLGGQLLIRVIVSPPHHLLCPFVRCWSSELTSLLHFSAPLTHLPTGSAPHRPQENLFFGLVFQVLFCSPSQNEFTYRIMKISPSFKSEPRTRSE